MAAQHKAGVKSAAGAERESGAQGRDRTADTAIFSRMLYQLSYLGASGEAEVEAS